MILRLICLFCCLGFATFALACEVVDDAGQTIKSNHPVHRIVSLAPDLTEILFAAGAGQQIVGVMRGSDYPIEAKKIPIVASFNSVDSEKILALQPDLIIVWGEGRLASQLKKLNIPIFYSHQKKLTEIPYTLRRFGCLAGTEKIAERAAQQFEQRYQALQKHYSQKKILTVFYEVWSQPLITVSQSSWINEVITLCGGKNIFANLKGAAPEVSLEAVLVANPEVIISTREWTKRQSPWSQMQAVQHHNLITLSPDLIERAGPRIMQGAQEMCEGLERVRISKYPLP